MRKPGLAATAGVLLAGAMAASISGCAALPALSLIPSLISMVHDLSSSKSDNPADTSTQETEAAEAEPSTPPPKLTMGNVCQMIAISRPDLVVVELRKGAGGTPEYRELRLVNSTETALWTPIVESDTSPDGWRPAVNFLKMDFKPPLTSAIPDSGSCYMAYAPVVADPNNHNPDQAAQLRSTFGGEVGAFSWDGRTYAYTVAPTLPCLNPSS